MWGQLTQKHRQLSNQVQHKMLRIYGAGLSLLLQACNGRGGGVINNRPPPSYRAARPLAQRAGCSSPLSPTPRSPAT